MDYWWNKTPWRYIQTNLRQTDMADMDAETYVFELKRFGATITMINTSGILASYPTELEFHTQSPYLTADSVRDVIEACHREGIHVIARTDFSKIRRAVYERHPEWAYRTPEGEIVDYNGDVHACINGGFQREYMLKILRETLTLLDVDGIYFNMAGFQTRDYSGVYHGICHCAACARLFRERFSLDLPKREDMADPAYRRYIEFKSEIEAEHGRRVCEEIRKIRPDILIHRDTYTTDSAYMREEDSTALDRGLPHWQYIGSEQSKAVRASYPGYRQSNCDVDFIDFPIRLVSVSPAQHDLRLVQGFANGGSPDYYLIGRLDNSEDKSAQDRVRALFAYHKKHEEYLDNTEPFSKIALLRPETFNRHTSAEYRGWYRALTEAHYPFDVVYSKRLETVGLGHYELIILPDDRYMSDSRAELLADFAARGGRIIATGETGCYDEHYERRDVPVPAAFGVREILSINEKARGSYFKITPDDSEVFSNFSPDERLIALDGAYIYASYAEDSKPLLSYIPPSPFGPPERCYYSQVTDLPGALEYGGVIHIPWYPGEFYYRQGYSNSLKFMEAILARSAYRHKVRGDISPMIEVSRMAVPSRGAELVSFVNASGHFGVSFFDPIPCDLRVSFSQDAKPTAILRLSDRTPLSHDYRDGVLTVELSRLGLYEAVIIEH